MRRAACGEEISDLGIEERFYFTTKGTKGFTKDTKRRLINKYFAAFAITFAPFAVKIKIVFKLFINLLSDDS